MKKYPDKENWFAGFFRLEFMYLGLIIVLSENAYFAGLAGNERDQQRINISD